MSVEEKAALIALVGVLVSALVSWLVSKKTIKYNYKELFAETVSQSRNKWLNAMRDFISTMLAEVQNPCPIAKDDEVCKNAECVLKNNNTLRTNKYWKARNEILLRLNLSEPLHLMLKNKILQLDGNNNEKTIEDIILISQSLLKEEWEKVKKEAKGE